MSDMQSARKVVSNPRESRNGNGWSAPPVVHAVADSESSAVRVRPNPFASMSGSPVKPLSFDDLSARRDDGETKNFSVPPELIALARANRAGRGHAGVLTPLAPKPTDEVVVVMPPAPAPLVSFSDEPSAMGEPAVASPLQPSEAVFDEPSAVEESGPRMIQAFLQAPGRSPGHALPPALPVAAAAPELEISPSSEVTAKGAGRSALRAYAPFFTATLVIGAYVTICYFANALIASLP